METGLLETGNTANLFRNFLWVLLSGNCRVISAGQLFTSGVSKGQREKSLDLRSVPVMAEVDRRSGHLTIRRLFQGDGSFALHGFHSLSRQHSRQNIDE